MLKPFQLLCGFATGAALLTACLARADGVPGTISTDPFDATRGTLILSHDTIIDPINAFRTNGGFEDGHTLMRNGGIGSVSYIDFLTGCRVNIQGVRLFASNDGAANSFRRSLSRFQLWADVDDNGSFETLVADTGAVNPDYGAQPGNASANPTVLDLTLTNIVGGVISAQRWRLETTQGSDVQPFEGARIIEVDALQPPISITNTNNSGPGSLRQAILDANLYPCPDTISFNLPGPGPHVIQPLTPLPQVTAPVSLDARTQPGYAGQPVVELRGGAVSNYNGLEIVSSNCVVAGLAFTHFTNGGTALIIAGPNAAWNWIHGNYFGLDTTGTNVAANDVGIGFGGDMHHNLIGTDGDGVNDAAERNLISGNQYGFVWYSAYSNRIAGNYIGTDISGTLPRGNQDAFYIDGSATGNIIGTDSSNDPFNANERNVISGNNDRGIILSGPNRVSGNYIGLDPTGSFAVPNQYGIQVTEVGSLVGSDGDGVRDDVERNVISGNSFAGIAVRGASTRDVIIRGNYIGTDASGTLAVPNDTGIIVFDQVHHSLVTGNVISGNTDSGLVMGDGVSSNNITANFIGLDATGTNALGNHAGISMGGGAHHNIIGTDGDGVNDAAERNIISGNFDGFVWYDAHTNRVAGNYIGTDISGTLARGNTFSAFYIDGSATGNIIGTDSSNDPFNANERNIISGNGAGILSAGPQRISGNYIGTDPTGSFAVPNVGGIQANGVGALIGSDGDGMYDDVERNVISGNLDVGIISGGPDTRDLVIRGNYIGTDASGTLALPNDYGISFNNHPHHMLITENVISGNTSIGLIAANGTHSNAITANFIGVDATGTNALGNGDAGVYLVDASWANTIGGTLSGDKNVIAYNSGYGVLIQGASSTNNSILGNAIFANSVGVGLFDAVNTTVGGVTAASRNVIAFNGSAGIVISGSQAAGNWIIGNYIGLDATGTNSAGNAHGIGLDNGAHHNLIGSNGDGVDDAAERNVISGNSCGFVMNNCFTNRIAGNYIGTDISGMLGRGNSFAGFCFDEISAGNIIGTDSSNDPFNTNERNVISGNGGGILLEGPNRVSGNFIGTDPTGAFAVPNAVGVQFGGFGPLIGSDGDGMHDDEERNVISGNSLAGIITGVTETQSAVIRGNYIGTDATGTAAVPNDVGMDIVSNAPITLVRGNLISGNVNRGIGIGSGSSGTVLFGNFIGTDVSGTNALGNGDVGVGLFDAVNTTIGGLTAASRNVIAFNGGSGVAVIGNTALRNSILGNAIFANGGLGIDLDLDGPTANDPFDGDNGPNGLQNFPVLTSVVADTDADATFINGYLPGPTNGPYRLEFFINTAADPTGFGEGKSMLTSHSLPFGGNSFTVVLAEWILPVGAWITATATDPFGNTSEFSAAQQVVPPAPVIDVQPVGGAFACGSNFTLSVTASGPGPLDYQWSQNFAPMFGATSSDLNLTASPGTAGDYFVVVSNPYGSVTSVVVTVSIVDTVPPVITCASNFTIECGTAWNFTSPGAFDSCDGTNVTIQLLSTITNYVCGQTFSATRTWRATDSSTNTATCSQTVTVVDTIPPVITCASNVVVECGTAWSFTAPTASDGCSGTNVTIVILSTVTNAGACPTRLTATRTWQATDGCTNSATCSQTVTVVDTTAPVLVGVPSPVTVQCVTDLPALPSVTATDTCDASPVVSLFTAISGSCPITYVYTWTARDSCSNTVSASVTNTVRDTVPPVLIGVPLNTNYQCLASVPPPANPFAIDNCVSNPVVLIFSAVTNGFAPRIITRTWIAIDPCTNVVSGSQTITVHDTVPPVIICPSNLVVQCGSAWSFTTPFATDNCDGPTVTVQLLGTVTNYICGQTFSATRTWRAIDNSTNTASCSQTVTIVDTTPPTIFCASNLVVSCGTAWNFTPPTAFDTCDTSNVSIQVISTVTNFSCGQNITATRTWRAMDNCTNSVTCSQTVTVADAIPPVIFCPSNLTVQCVSGIPPLPGSLGAFFSAGGSASDNCDTNLSYFCSDGPLIGGICGGTIVRTHTVVDDCTNAASCIQIITVRDTVPPVIFCPSNLTVQCASGVPPLPGSRGAFFSAGGSASDNCDTNLTYFCSDGPLIGGICGGTIVRTHTVVDDCTNAASCVQIITVRDTVPPIIICPSNLTVQCVSGIPPLPGGLGAFFSAGGSASDNCDTNLAYFCSDGPLIGGICGGTIVRTHTVVDDCTNAASCVQIITVRDTVPPVLIGVPANTNYQCLAQVPPPAAVTATDNCSTNPLMLFNAVTNGFAPRIITRTWTAIDSCTNTASGSQTITVNDTVPPALACASNLVVQCGTAWNFSPPFASDNCDGTNLTVQILSTITNASCGRTYSATRTWRAFDSHTNTATCSQTVFVVDTTPPVITCASNRFVECGTAWSFNPPTATDLCGGTNVTITILSTVTNPLVGTTFSATRTWRAMDACTNTAVCSQTITVVDTVPPAISCPPNMVVAEFPSNSGVAFVTYPAPVVSDACDPALTVVCLPPSGTNFPTGSTTVTCTVTDDSGNSRSCYFIVRVIPYRLVVTTTANAGAGSLRQALLDANAGPGGNLVVFNLPGAAPHVITLASALPAQTGPVIINGASQPGYDGAPVVAVNGAGAGGADGIVLQAGNSTVRGLALHGFGAALRLDGGGNFIEGNYLGTDTTGANAPGVTSNGVRVASANNYILNNLISGNRLAGLHLTGAGAISNVIVRNLIGTAAGGVAPLGNGREGVLLSSGAARNTIGGTSNNLANVIAFNGGNGVTLEGTAGAGNSIRGSRIYLNSLIGLDLVGDGPSPNDEGDFDFGPNNRQNFPVLSAALYNDGITIINGVMDGVAGQTYQLDFFLNDVTDPSGYGEGAMYLGSAGVTPSSDSFAVQFPVTTTPGQFITATATDPAGNTSEFSPPVPVGSPPVIVTPPAPVNAPPGAPASFCVEATGSPPIFYQWRHNGVNIDGANGPCYTIPASQANDGGTYDAVILSSLGAQLSGPAPLTLTFSNVAAGDNFAARTPLNGSTGIVTWHNRGATVEPGEPAHAGKAGGKSVWYKWVAPRTGIATVGTRGSTFDTLLGVYQGTAFSNFTAVAYDEDRGGFYSSGVRFNVVQGQEYQIAVDGFGGAEGDFVFGWSIEITAVPLPVIDAQPVSQTVGPGGTAVFAVVAPATCCQSQVGCCECHNPDPQNPAPAPACVSFQWYLNGVALPGATQATLTITNVQPANLGTYTVRISNLLRTIESQDAILQINETGLDVQPVMAHDKFLDAVLDANPLRLGTPPPIPLFAPAGATFTPAAVVRGYTSTHTFDTRNASTELGEEPICGTIGGKSEWITFLPEETGTLHINTDGSSYDTVMAVFVRNPADPARLLYVTCDNDSGAGNASALNIPVEAGKTNYIVVDGVKSGSSIASGTLKLRFSLLTPATLTSLGFTEARAHKLRVNTHLEASFSIQFTTDFVTWTTLHTVTGATTTQYEYTDTGAANAPRRLYRVLMLP